MNDLRKKLIKVAYENPGEVRDALLPILRAWEQRKMEGTAPDFTDTLGDGTEVAVTCIDRSQIVHEAMLKEAKYGKGRIVKFKRALGELLVDVEGYGLVKVTLDSSGMTTTHGRHPSAVTWAALQAVKAYRKAGFPLIRPHEKWPKEAAERNELKLGPNEVFAKATSHRAYQTVARRLGRKPQTYNRPLTYTKRPAASHYHFVVTKDEFEKLTGITGVSKAQVRGEWVTPLKLAKEAYVRPTFNIAKPTMADVKQAYKVGWKAAQEGGGFDPSMDASLEARAQRELEMLAADLKGDVQRVVRGTGMTTMKLNDIAMDVAFLAFWSGVHDGAR